MKIWFDTEFIEDGRTIELISIGAVREDGERFYAENADCDLSRADDWVKKHVITHLRGGADQINRRQIADDEDDLTELVKDSFGHGPYELEFLIE